MESLSGPIKVFYRQNRIKIDKKRHFWKDFNILFQKKRVEDPNRVLLYIREADTEVYDALMLESPDLNGLTKAVSKNFQFELENSIFVCKNCLRFTFKNDPKIQFFDIFCSKTTKFDYFFMFHVIIRFKWKFCSPKWTFVKHPFFRFAQNLDSSLLILIEFTKNLKRELFWIWMIL